MRSDCLYLLMPCYNEEANIETVINHWYSVCKVLEESGARCNIVVANDGSKDGTLKKLNSLTEQIPILEVIEMPEGQVSGISLSNSFEEER